MIAYEQFSQWLSRHFSPVSSLTDNQIAALYRHCQLLELWNKKLNLTAIADAEHAVLRHYCESLFLGTLLPPEAVSVADIGSGAGFPGIPVAVLRPDCQITLIESHQRKAVFLREATRGFPHVQVLGTRAEDVESRFEWAVCRAVKWVQVVKTMARVACQAGFLIGQDDAAELVKTAGIDWQKPIRMPWGERRVVVIGSSRVSRET